MGDQHGYFIVDNNDGREPVIYGPGRDYELCSDATLIAYHGNEEVVELPWNVKNIAAGAFKNNECLQLVRIGSSTTHIEAEAFMGCTSLEAVIITGVYSECDEEGVTVLYGNSVESIGDRAFKGCRSLQSVEFDGQDRDEGGTWADFLNIGVEAFAGCSSLEIMDLHCIGGWLSVGDRAFAGCTSLEAVELPDALGELGDDVFEGCTALKLLSVPGYLREGTKAREDAYDDAIRLIEERHPSLDVEVRSVHFSYEKTPWTIVFWSPWAWTPERFRRRRTQIAYRDVASWWKGRKALGLFKGFSSLETVDLTGLDTSQEGSLACMFKGCASLESVTIPRLDTSKVTDMRQMFFGCRSLRRLDLSGLDTSRVESMAHLLHNCRSLEQVNLSGLDLSRLESLWSGFDGCSSLTSLDLSGLSTPMLKSVGYLFRDCTSLERWSVSESWPVNFLDAIPSPTNGRGAWWSVRDQAWMTTSEIKARGPVADTYTSEPEAAQEPEGLGDEATLPSETTD